jgi:hypothetical protein
MVPLPTWARACGRCRCQQPDQLSRNSTGHLPTALRYQRSGGLERSGRYQRPARDSIERTERRPRQEPRAFFCKKNRSSGLNAEEYQMLSNVEYLDDRLQSGTNTGGGSAGQTFASFLSWWPQAEQVQCSRVVFVERSGIALPSRMARSPQLRQTSGGHFPPSFCSSSARRRSSSGTRRAASRVCFQTSHRSISSIRSLRPSNG